MLKLYTNKTYLTETYRKKVFPLLFDLCYLKHETLLEFYQVVDEVQDCDIMVMPIDYAEFIKHQSDFEALINLSKSHNKPLWIYTAGDFGFTNTIENAYTFRLGGFKSRLPKGTFVMPSFINDPYEHILKENTFIPLKKTKKPSIGFVGHAQSGFGKYLKEYVSHFKFFIKRSIKSLVADAQSFYPSGIRRALVLEELSKSDGINSNFILRNHYRAGAQKEKEKEQTSKAFFQNMYINAYTFCMRGRGNFSVRFYETLAVGRIPILLDTDCKLPLEEVIPWKKHVVIVDFKSTMTMEDQILNFHNNLSDEEFEVLQQSNRNLWLNILRRECYFMEIYKKFVAV